MLLIDFFKQGVEKYRDRICVMDGELAYTYAEMDAHCEAGGCQRVGYGCGKPDRQAGRKSEKR